jgi:hypothetical protein
MLDALAASGTEMATASIRRIIAKAWSIWWVGAISCCPTPRAARR